MSNLLPFFFGTEPQWDSSSEAEAKDTLIHYHSFISEHLHAVHTHKSGPKYKMQTVCTFQMNWVMRSNNKISLCCGDSEMAIIQQCSHFRQRTFSYIMHPNHCIFPPFWATMHISSSQWNIKHSYDLIFSSKGDFSLYIFFTSLASPLGPNFWGCLYLACLFAGEMFDWLMLE